MDRAEAKDGRMSFWGVEVKPGKPVPFVPPPEAVKLHVSQVSRRDGMGGVPCMHADGDWPGGRSLRRQPCHVQSQEPASLPAALAQTMRPTPVQPNPPSQTTTATAHTHMNHMLERTPLHSQACIAGSKKGDTARLLVKTGELETPLALCVLRDGGAENANLDLVFDEYAEFSVAGAAAVHVTGYLMPEFEGGVLLGELRVVRIPEELVFWHAGGPGLSAALEADHPASTNVHAHGRRAEDEHDESDEEGHDDMFSLHDEDDSDFDSEEGGAGLGRHGERVGAFGCCGRLVEGSPVWARPPGPCCSLWHGGRRWSARRRRGGALTARLPLDAQRRLAPPCAPACHGPPLSADSEEDDSEEDDEVVPVGRSRVEIKDITVRARGCGEGGELVCWDARKAWGRRCAQEIGVCTSKRQPLFPRPRQKTLLLPKKTLPRMRTSWRPRATVTAASRSPASLVSAWVGRSSRLPGRANSSPPMCGQSRLEGLVTTAMPSP